MALFDFVENFFFISLGITFALILLLVYHFKQRISSMERKGDTMFELLSNVVKEMQCLKGMNLYYESLFASPKTELSPTCPINANYSACVAEAETKGIRSNSEERSSKEFEKKIIDLSVEDSNSPEFMVGKLNVVKHENIFVKYSENQSSPEFVSSTNLLRATDSKIIVSDDSDSESDSDEEYSDDEYSDNLDDDSDDSGDESTKSRIKTPTVVEIETADHIQGFTESIERRQSAIFGTDEIVLEEVEIFGKDEISYKNGIFAESDGSRKFDSEKYSGCVAEGELNEMQENFEILGRDEEHSKSPLEQSSSPLEQSSSEFATSDGVCSQNVAVPSLENFKDLRSPKDVVNSYENASEPIISTPLFLGETIDGTQLQVDDALALAQKREVYLKMNITQLKALAISAGIQQDTSKMKKKELISLLENLDE